MVSQPPTGIKWEDLGGNFSLIGWKLNKVDLKLWLIVDTSPGD